VLGALDFLHSLGARALVLYAVLLGVWGTYSYFRHDRVSGGFRSSFLVMTGLVVAQGAFGVIVFFAAQRPHELLHVVYGIFSVLFLPGVYLYAHAGSPRREALVLAGAAWIVSVAFVRGIATG
jgi:heme A synthase